MEISDKHDSAPKKRTEKFSLEMFITSKRLYREILMGEIKPVVTQKYQLEYWFKSLLTDVCGFSEAQDSDARNKYIGSHYKDLNQKPILYFDRKMSFNMKEIQYQLFFCHSLNIESTERYAAADILSEKICVVWVWKN